MRHDRRKFFGNAAVGAVAVTAGPALTSCAETGHYEPGKGGTRWAMVVDLRKCAEHEDCRACTDACHKKHNVPDFGDNILHEIKWIWKEHKFDHVFPSYLNHPLPARVGKKPVLVLCNHCDNPPCVRVCPTKATWRREDGIVMMDWHRCIGCRYCVVACPYGSRSFNWVNPRPHVKEITNGFPTRMKGVVEKCTLCEERILHNRLPACVEACPHGALVFGNLEDPNSEVAKIVATEFTIRRKPDLGTEPEVYYVV
ncbi:MAG: 4Fe-4S ferredoxin [Deltaproteobacteria bacterium HGW-Deltaproteobacteria-20]|jgi:molybdopterin-containing oxidoreductase family iron-sulfur binding subunit|nr:MAG: 4Fe-4S ferredoxin [Deltaproteobacteria bacterium HGW-Deltaproteobacteria-20]